jgi:hypothetical protein
MDPTFITKFVTHFIIIWSILVLGTLAWRQFVTTRFARVPNGRVSTVENIHARLAVEAAAAARARQRRH